MKIRVQSMYGAEPLMCSTNVQKRIAALGGKEIYGWQIENHKFIEACRNHCVWEARFDDKASTTQYRPLIKDDNLRKACNFMARSDDKLAAGDLVGCQHWTRRANEAVRRSRYPFEFLAPESLRMKDLISQMYA